MRIAVFSDNFYPELSGISDSLTSLAKELARRGHAINFFVPSYSESNYARVGVPQKELDLGPSVAFTRLFSIHFPTGTGQGRMVIPTGMRWRVLKKFKPDVVHSQHFFGAGLEGLMAAKKLGVPLIGTNHTAIKEFVRYSPVKAEWFQNLMIRYVNWYYSKCLFITAPSRSVIDEMEFFGFRGESHVLSNPIDTEMFRPLANRNWLVKKYGFNENTIIHAGRLSPERNVDVVMKALPLIQKEIPDAKLAIAGSGSDEKNLKALALTLGIENDVRWLGVLDKASLAEAYNAAKIFVIASTSDTQSMVMMQALAAGIPVVAVKARALPEYVNAKNGALVGVGNVEGLAKETLRILKDRELRLRLGEGARDSANRFSMPAIATIWEDIYQKAAARDGGREPQRKTP